MREGVDRLFPRALWCSACRGYLPDISALRTMPTTILIVVEVRAFDHSVPTLLLLSKEDVTRDRFLAELAPMGARG